MRLGIISVQNIGEKFIDNVNTKETINLCKILNYKDNTCEIVDYSCNQEDYDAIFIMNYSLNFFGGVEGNKNILKNISWLSKFKGDLYWLQVDYRMFPKNAYKDVKNKPWNIYKEEDLVYKQPTIISQFKTLKKEYKDNSIYVPLVSHIFKSDKEVRNTRDVDLIYIGSTRGRTNKMYEYFFNSSLDIHTFGSIKEKDFNKFDTSNPPKFNKKVLPCDVVKTNSKGFATIILPEKGYNNNTITLRIIESLLAGQVVFVDEEFDTKHNLFNTSFVYVKNRKELEDRIKELKANEDLYNEIVEIQKQFLNKVKNFKIEDFLYELVKNRFESKDEKLPSRFKIEGLI